MVVTPVNSSVVAPVSTYSDLRAGTPACPSFSLTDAWCNSCWFEFGAGCAGAMTRGGAGLKVEVRSHEGGVGSAERQGPPFAAEQHYSEDLGPPRPLLVLTVMFLQFM